MVNAVLPDVHITVLLTDFVIFQDIRIFSSGLSVHLGGKLLLKSFFQTLILFFP